MKKDISSGDSVLENSTSKEELLRATMSHYLGVSDRDLITFVACK